MSNRFILHGLSKMIDLVDNDDLWLCSAKYGFGLMDKKTGKGKYIAQFNSDKSKMEHLQSNDAAIDSKGRIWTGTMADPINFDKFEGT
jgi:sugar lactone lactonase YvrE